MNQHFETLNPVDYGWKVSREKLKPNWFDGSALPSVEGTNQENNNLDTLAHYQMSVKELTTLSVTQRMKIKIFAYVSPTMEKNRIGY